MPSSAALQPSGVEFLTPGKRRTAIQRKKSDTEELKRALKGQEESVRRKQAISESLGKWENTESSIRSTRSTRRSSIGNENSTRSTRRSSIGTESSTRSTRRSSIGRKNAGREEESFSFIMEEPSTTDLKKRRSTRRRSGSHDRPVEVPPVSIRRESSRREKMDRARSSSPHGLRKKTDRSTSPGNLRKRTSRRASVAGSGDTGNLGQMLNNVDGEKTFKRGGGRSVASAPSQLQPDADKSPVPPERRKSSMRARRPRRTKSSELSSIVLNEEEAPKKPKRRAKSVEQSYRNDKSTKKSTRKSKLKKKTDYDGEYTNSSGGEEEKQVIRVKREDRRGATDRSKKRSHSAGPLKRNEEVGVLSPERIKPQRSNSSGPGIMMNRDMTRRGKSNSLADLVQYSEDEIHSTSYFASNHVLVNRERMKRGIRPLTRNNAMDVQARQNAEAMADTAGSSQLRTTYVGNVLRGESIRAVHRATMMNKEGRERANLLNPYFQDFGVGTAKGDDGMLYVCQLFSERLELNCTDFGASTDSD